MSVTVKLFAALRETLGESEMKVELSEVASELTSGSSVVDVAAVKALLAKRGVHWREALYQPNLVHALNHKVVFIDALVSDGDELAFFPPMTGG